VGITTRSILPGGNKAPRQLLRQPSGRSVEIRFALDSATFAQSKYDPASVPPPRERDFATVPIFQQ